MRNDLRASVLQELQNRYGQLRKLPGSQSLHEVGDGALRIYLRYSRVHDGNCTFYGLRDEDLRQLEGYPSVICFLWDHQVSPLFLPFSEFEEVLHSTEPARDGQYKVQVQFQRAGTELYIARGGRHNVDGYTGWSIVEGLLDSGKMATTPLLTHAQVQGLLGAIGTRKQFDIWVPLADRSKVHGGQEFTCREELPAGLGNAATTLQDVDVVWIERGSGRLRALFEVEHSTPIYSGLLRFNDVHLIVPQLKPTYSIVANDERRSLFVRQLSRPTFRSSGLSELCTFMRYENVFAWHERVTKERS